MSREPRCASQGTVLASARYAEQPSQAAVPMHAVPVPRRTIMAILGTIAITTATSAARILPARMWREGVYHGQPCSGTCRRAVWPQWAVCHPVARRFFSVDELNQQRSINLDRPSCTKDRTIRTRPLVGPPIDQAAPLRDPHFVLEPDLDQQSSVPCPCRRSSFGKRYGS
jgi:hypothetical protein